MYYIGGTDSYRLASKTIFKSPWFDGWGTNLQNIEKWVRRMYCADPGKKLVQVDQAGAEALIVAYLCRAGRFRELFLYKIKPHVFVGLHLFKDVWEDELRKSGKDLILDINELTRCTIPELPLHPYWKEVEAIIKDSDNWPAERRYYYMSKQVCHSSNYGIKAGMFSLNTLEKSRGKVVIPTKKSAEFLSVYHGLFPEIREWHMETIKRVEETGYLYTLQGYPIHIQVADKTGDQDYKKWHALVPQGTVALITRKAFRDMYYFIKAERLQWDIIQDNHDSYLIQAPESEVLECAKKAKEFMEQELHAPRGEVFRMRAEVQTGYNWGPYKKDKNPDGMQELKI